MLRIIQWLDRHFEESVIFIALSSMSIIITLQVIMRYVFQESLAWSEEVSRYLFIWLIYIGISYGVKKDAHVAVTVLDFALNPKQQKYLQVLTTIIFFLFAVAIFWYGRSVCSTIARLGQHAPATDLSMWLVYAAVPTGFLLTCVRLVQKFMRQIKEFNATPNN